jgi:hypothetical protein
MKHTTLAAITSLLLAAPAFAQQLQLPAPSPAASVKQTVGLTDVTIEYSSPAVKGRKIWGDLVPYDAPWRAGANQATKITFSKDVTFGGKPVPAGTYALVALPTAKGWTMILNKELGLWSAKPYSAKDDVVRVSATTSAIPQRERLAYLFNNTTDDQTSLDLEWEKLRVSVPVKTDTAAQTQASIKSALENAWRPHAMAARYIGETSKDYDTGLKYVDASIAMSSTWFNNWIKADLLAKKGNYAEARKYAQTAWDLGQKDKNFFFKNQVQKALNDWKNKT